MTSLESLRLPPLSALRAFEAVTRLASVKDAAHELGLTASAVSHQLRNLEEHLGVALFQRRNRGVELTDAGTRLAPHIESAFRELRYAVSALRRDPETSVLRVSVAPMFATELIMPSIQDFERRHPTVQLRLEVSQTNADFDTEPVDASIRLGPVPSTALYTETLLDVVVAPVCSPKLLEGPGALRSIDDLKSHALISLTHQTTSPSTWQRWATAAGCSDLKPARELWFDTFIGALQAAESGLGIVIAPHPIVARHLAERRLVMPFPIFAPSPWAYRFLCRRGHERLTKIEAFRQWITELVSTHRGLVPTASRPKFAVE